MIRHLLAPVLPVAAASLKLPRTEPHADGVALTFDDGPHPVGTPSILEILSRAGVRATFFMVGEQVQRRPELAAEVLAAGHVVALHGYRHRLQLRCSTAAVRDDIARGIDTLGAATGARPWLHRPPYGIYSAAGLDSIREAGLAPLLWSQWGRDWRKFTTPARIAARSAGHARAGDVILLHDADFYSARDSHLRTAQALGLILSELGGRGIGTVLPV